MEHEASTWSQPITLHGVVFPQMNTTEATQHQPHLWSLHKHSSQLSPFSLPLNCSHTATSPSHSEFQESCSTWFGVTQVWVQQHELLHMNTHTDQGRSVGARVAPPGATT